MKKESINSVGTAEIENCNCKTYLGMTRGLRFTFSMMSLLTFVVLSLSLVEGAPSHDMSVRENSLISGTNVTFNDFWELDYDSMTEFEDSFNLSQRIEAGLYPADAVEKYAVGKASSTDLSKFDKRLAPTWFFFGAVALIIQTGVQIDQTIQSCQDRNNELRGTRACIRNCFTTVALLAADITAVGTAFATVVKRDEEGRILLPEHALKSHHKDNPTFKYWGKSNSSLYGLDGTSSDAMHYSVDLGGGLKHVTIAMHEGKFHSLLHHADLDHPHTQVSKRNEYEGQSLSGETMDTRYCHVGGRSESLDHNKDWDQVYGWIQCNDGIFFEDNSHKLQCYDKNKEGTIFEYQTAVRKTSSDSGLKCEGGINGGSCN